MQAGKLKQKIQFLTKELTPDGMGGNTETEEEALTAWAEVTPLRGDRLYYAQQRDAGTDTQIKIRKPSIIDITPKMIIRHGVAKYEIKGIINTASADKELIINARALLSEAETVIIGAPDILTPAQSEILSADNFQTTFSSFDTAGETHLKTRFQIAADAEINFINPVIDITMTGTETNPVPEYYDVPDGTLAPDTAYRIRARFYGVKYGPGPWGAVITFLTSNK